MKNWSRRLMVIAATLWAASLVAPAAFAASLDQLRSSGVVQERFDGFLEIRQSTAGADARQLVHEVNVRRRALYEKRAQEQNVPVAEVGKLFASEIFQSAPVGTYFRSANGGIVRK